jgi:single-stranded-DNA-specific exonuclease
MKPAFLNVERSIKGDRWIARLNDQRMGEAISQQLDLPDILGRVLAGRNIAVTEAEQFLNPTLRALMPQPSALMDMDKGSARFAEAIMSDEKIGFITDYDVDGVSSGALLLRYVRALGRDAIVHIPDRISEGYGPSAQAVTDLKGKGVQLLVTLDCGVLSHDPLAHATDLGLTVIIVDHHQASEELPQAHAVINPNRLDDTSGLGFLCAAGVAMIFIAAVNRHLRQRGFFADGKTEPNILQWLELVALATVCDVVPLKGLNRAYVTQGLKVMSRRANQGLAALADVAALKSRPDVYALGFVLGPRINAAGRVGHANDALNLLLADDRGEAMQLAQALDTLNRKRQLIEQRAVDEAVLQADAALGVRHNASVIVTSSNAWHPGVVGLAAARLKERFRLPSFALATNTKTGFATGSGRSMSGADMGLIVRQARDAGIIEKGGGHAMAAGLTVKIEKLAELREFMENAFQPFANTASSHVLEIDGAVTASGATLDLIELLEQAGPYGSGNPQPVFAFPAHRIAYADLAGTDHVRCTLVSSDGMRIKAIAFRSASSELGELLLSERNFPLHVAGRLVVDEWGNKRVPSVQIIDAAPVK